MTSPEIIFEDAHFIVVNKPAGILTIPDRWDKTKVSLSGLMRQTLGSSLRMVHRLDKETSGLILFTKDLESQRALSRQFERHAVAKTYLALVDGELRKASGKVTLPLEEHPGQKGRTRVAKKGGKPSTTLYRTASRFRGFTLLAVSPLSGRTHQIRVHLASLEHPLAVDRFYGRRSALYLSELKPNFKKKKEGEKPLLSRLSLHAAKLSFQTMDGHNITLEAPLPKDFEVTLKSLRKYRSLT